jgi:hypothetical protein
MESGEFGALEAIHIINCLAQGVAPDAGETSVEESAEARKREAADAEGAV